jgi:stage II sporulation protein AA (anti-sigma F factor antagonist)
MSPPLEVTEQEPRTGAVHVMLSGELDLASAYAFDRRMLGVEARQPEVVVLDLRGVTMLDSAGLARLISAQRRARRGGWRLVIVRGGRVVQRVLQTTGLDEMLEMTSDPGAYLREGRPAR